MSLSRRRLLASLAAAPALACVRREALRPPTPAGSRADTLVIGEIVTNDPSLPRAGALGIVDGAIVDRSRDRDGLDHLRGADTRVLTLDSACALPGLTDAHAHLLGLGQTREIIDLRGVGSIAEVVARLRAEAPPGDGWILGRGWDQNRWGGDMPTRAALDEVFLGRPVWLRRIDGHAGWANTATLERAGIGDGAANPGNPEGGEILRDDRGRATGVLVDAAMDRVPVPIPSRADVDRWLRAACREAVSLGLTGVHEMGVGADGHAVFTELALAGALPMRIHGYADEAWFEAGLDGHGPTSVDPATRYALSGVKLYADGALGSRGAALLAPYADRPDHAGALMHEPPVFTELVSRALAAGLQVATHAIGDRGNRTILDAYAEALARIEGGGAGAETGDRRLRIEHVQVIDLADIPRLAALGLVASMQPTHATSDMPWAPQRLGPARLAGAYAWQRMLAAGVPLAFGSDFPVERPSPLLGLYAAVTRQDLAGQPEGGWLPDQRLELGQAIAAFSSGPAWAVHREGHLGVLAPGYRADLTVLAGDPFAVEARAIVELPVRMTIVDGEVVYEG